MWPDRTVLLAFPLRFALLLYGRAPYVVRPAAEACRWPTQDRCPARSADRSLRSGLGGRTQGNMKNDPDGARDGADAHRFVHEGRVDDTRSSSKRTMATVKCGWILRDVETHS
jgi:hypothetical protein